MTVPTVALLKELRTAGLRLAPVDGGRLHVTPRGRLTSDLRARILDSKPALLAALEAEAHLAANLEQRVRAMAARWNYAPEELAEVLEAGRRNPAGILMTLEDDERRADLAARIGRRYPA